VRLTRVSGTWFLEFTRLVAIDEQLMRPERRRVPATLSTLRVVAESCPPERIREAETLMQQADDGSERAFELDDDGWLSAAPGTRSQRPPARAEVYALIAELRAELVGVQALCEALRARVVALEAAELTRQSEVSEQEPKPVAKVPSRRDVLSALRGESGGEARAAGAAPPAGSAPSPVAPVVQLPLAAAPAPSLAQASTVATPPAAPAAEAAPGGEGLILPRQTELLDCLQMLAADVALEGYAGEPPDDLSELFLARAVDENKEERGLLLADRRASAALGGGLLGLPWAAREQQGERGLEQDTFEALQEIFNNLGGVLNRVNPKCYTRLGTLERGAPRAPAWFSSGARRVGFATAKGGRLWLVAR
jgi:hypothetical protein